MQQVLEQQVCLFAISDKDTQGGIKLELVGLRHRYYMDDNAIHVDNIEIRIPIAKSINMDELRLKAIDTLKQKQKQVTLDAAVRIQELQRKIEDLQLLEYRPTTGEEDGRRADADEASVFG